MHKRSIVLLLLPTAAVLLATNKRNRKKNKQTQILYIGNNVGHNSKDDEFLGDF